MPLLLAATDSIELVTLSADQVTTHASFLQYSSGASIAGSQNQSISSATTTTIVAAPGASTQRSVRTLIIICLGTSVAIRLRHARSAGTTDTLWSGTLLTNDILTIDKRGRIQRIDATLARDVQTFTASGIWVKPTTFVPKFVIAVCVGGGGGGGGGDLGGQPAGVNTGGGGGGGGGACNSRQFLATQLPATINVHVANGGIGGLGATTTAAGAVGGDGGDSRFHTCAAYGGGGGAVGSSSGGNGGGGGGTAGRASGATGGLPAKSFPVCAGAGCTAQSQTNVYGEYGGGAGGTLNTSFLPVAAGDSIHGGGGGGCGGGHIFAGSIFTSAQPGGNAGQFTFTLGTYTGGGGAAGGAIYTAGSDGTNGDSTKCGQGGGGGGYSDNTTNNGGAGGAGGTCGGGGGGGGAAPFGLNATNPAQVGGKGGNGGRGEVRVFTY